jgi:hypothetical protein
VSSTNVMRVALLLAGMMPALQSRAAAQEPGAGQEPETTPQATEPAQEPDPLRASHGPWNEDLVLLSSTNGSSWSSVGVIASGASSPSVCRMADGRLILAHQAYPADDPEHFDRAVVRFSDDDGATWSEPEALDLAGFPQGLRPPFDPCVVALEDGRLRLYFSSHAEPPAEDGSYGTDGWPSTYSAVSTDGHAWNFEPGKRFGIEAQPVTSPCVVHFQGEWHYFAPVPGREGSAFHALSRDGLAFQRLTEVELEGSGRWLGCALAEDELGESGVVLRFYGTERIGWSATSRDGARWRLDGRVTWSQGADPSVVRLRDGGWLMVATTPGAEPGDAEMDLLSALSGGSDVAMTANNRYLYVLRGDTIYMFDATTLRLIRMQRLPPAAAPARTEGPAPGSRVGPSRRSNASGH